MYRNRFRSDALLHGRDEVWDRTNQDHFQRVDSRCCIDYDLRKHILNNLGPHKTFDDPKMKPFGA